MSTHQTLDAMVAGPLRRIFAVGLAVGAYHWCAGNYDAGAINLALGSAGLWISYHWGVREVTP